MSTMKHDCKRYLKSFELLFSQRLQDLTAMFKIALLGVLLGGVLPLAAQVATADILGTVTDSAGAVVPGASIRIENAGTHEARTFTTGGAGEYTFTALQPGTYTLTATSPTFKTFTTSNIVISASDRVRINATLQPGNVDENVEVTATPTSLQTDNDTVGSTITEKTLLDAPLNGRNYFGLVQLQAGVNGGSQGSIINGSSQADRRPSSSISANGQQEIFNNNLIDGLDDNDRIFGTALIRPSVEAIAEVRTDINTYNAEVGRTGGAVINVITKSGANQFHGSAYEFFRNDITDARNFFAKAGTVRRPELRQNQFGGSFSGPIIRDKTFFFVDFEAFRRIDATNTVSVLPVPTAAEQATPGYLQDIKNPLYDPSRPTSPTNSPVVANIPAAAALDPTALGYFKLFPMPNYYLTSPSLASPVLDAFLYDPAQSFYSSVGDIRIDQHFSQKDTLFGRYSYNRSTALTPSSFPNVNGIAPGGSLTNNGLSVILAHNGQLAYTHIFTPSLLMELKAAYTLADIATQPLNYGTNYNDQAPYKIPNANECFVCSGLATVAVNGYGTLGDAGTEPADDLEHNTHFAGSITYVRGRQSFKAGAGVIRRNFPYLTEVTPKGYFIFPAVAVNTPQVKVYRPSLENFLLGAPFASLREGLTARPYERTWEPSGYFQDDWRVTEHLTLNLGARYEVFTKPNAKYNNNSNFDLNSLSIINNATGGQQTRYTDLSPRVGFDATLGKGTVLRGGFGLGYFVSALSNSVVLINPPLGFNTGIVVNTTPLSTTGVVPFVPQSTAPASLVSPFSLGRNDVDSYVEQFNLLLQKEYRGTVFTAGYVAELGRHLSDTVPNVNVPAPSGSAVTPPKPYAVQLPHVNSIQYYGNFGASSYNSVQVSAERRVSHGLTANINYTYARNLDDVFSAFDGDGFNSAFGLLPGQVSSYDYGNSPLDLKSRAAGFFSYDLPLGKDGSRFYRAAAGGFRFNGIGFWQTGSPFTVTDATTQANGFATINLPTVTVDKPNVVGPFNSGSAINGPAFNLNAFAEQTVGTAGNERRNQLFGPHLRRGDLSLFKTIPLHERAQLELRAECFNFTNTPNFAQPGNVISGANYGSITNTVFNYAGRQYQFAGRFSF